jgi:hypothetical protein
VVEHLPFKQRVERSIRSTPTRREFKSISEFKMYKLIKSLLIGTSAVLLAYVVVGFAQSEPMWVFNEIQRSFTARLLTVLFISFVSFLAFDWLRRSEKQAQETQGLNTFKAIILLAVLAFVIFSPVAFLVLLGWSDG